MPEQEVVGAEVAVDERDRRPTPAPPVGDATGEALEQLEHALVESITQAGLDLVDHPRHPLGGRLGSRLDIVVVGAEGRLVEPPPRRGVQRCGLLDGELELRAGQVDELVAGFGVA